MCVNNINTQEEWKSGMTHSPHYINAQEPLEMPTQHRGHSVGFCMFAKTLEKVCQENQDGSHFYFDKIYIDTYKFT